MYSLSEGGTDDEEFRSVAVVDRVNTTLAVWMGTSMACAQRAGGKSIRASVVMPTRSNGAGFVGNGCVGDVHSPGTPFWGTGRSSIGQIGLPVTRSNT